MHTPVLLQQAVDALNVQNGGKYIDATFGEGGHSFEIVKRGGNVLAFDWDEENVKEKNIEIKKMCSGLKQDVSIQLVMTNYADIEAKTHEYKFYPVDGILFDLGLSMNQIASSQKGFSYERPDEVLDMRINKILNITAGDIINSFTEESLYEIFSKNAEEINSRPIAHAIVFTRRVKHILTVGDLLSVIQKISRDKRTFARIFQALRIEVNHEFENIKKALEGSKKILKPDGKIVIITFHPSEDRLIKLFAGELNLGIQKPLKSKDGKKFERSAKLRILTI